MHTPMFKNQRSGNTTRPGPYAVEHCRRAIVEAENGGMVDHEEFSYLFALRGNSEFDDEYVQGAEIPCGAKDTSYGNDVSPSYAMCTGLADPDGAQGMLAHAPPGEDLHLPSIRLWVQHPEYDMRECGGDRYTLDLVDDWSGDSHGGIFESDDPWTMTVYAVAMAFSLHLRRYLGAAGMARLVRKNRHHLGRPDECHSHDECDANEFMCDAMADVFGWMAVSEDNPEPPFPTLNPVVDLMNLAWDAAKGADFFHPEIEALRAGRDA